MKLAKALIPLLAALALPGMASAQKMDNPFSDSPKMYVNPAFTANANAEAAKETDATLKARMQLIGQQPGAVWMDRISALASLEGHLDATLAQGAKVFLGIVYDLPGRDCAALASNGELPGTAAGLARYKTEYIDEYARIVGLSKFSGLRVVLVIEPDSLPNLVTNLSDPECGQMDSSGIYAQGVQYAVNKLGALPNTYLYIDAGHSGWLGWPNNMDGWVTKMGTIAAGFTNGKSAIHGFVDDTANTLPLKEPFLATGMTVGGQDIKSSKFYDWNPFVDEAGYSAELYRRFTGAGWPSSMGIILDTSRNGWGGTARPTAASTSTVMDTFVNASRVDRRNHRGLWCNPSGAGIGELPKGAPADWSAQHWDAFLWVKPPGESDGNSYEIPNDQGKSFDHMCDPTYTTQYGVLTGALPNAPLAGDWFPAQFKMLVQNIYPIPGSGPQCQGVPTGPTNLVVTARTASTVSLSWTAGSAPPNCSLSYVVHRGTTNNFTPSASTQVATGVTGSPYTVTGLSPNTTYYFMVQAVDQIGAAGSNYIQTNTENGYTLTVTKAGTGTGTVTGASGLINCGSTCTAVINANPVQTVTLTAAPASGSSFTGWTGCTGGSGATCLVEMNGVRSVTATFGGATQTYALTVTKSGAGTGTVSGGGIDCGSTCTAQVAAGTVTLTAAAGTNSSFSGWSGACNGTATTCAVTVSAATSVGAAFASIGTTNYTLTVAKSGTGTGTVSGGSISCGSTCSVTAASGTTVTLTAAAASGSTFSGWSGACTGTGNCVVTLTSNVTATASFTAQQTGNTPVAINGRLQRCGNRICNASGTAVQFKGMSWFWSNTTWGAERFYNASAVQSLATDWKASIVRAAIGVHGGGGYYSGDTLTPADPTGNMARAKALIDGAIAAGVYVIVDWHSHELHQAEAQAFFQTLATQYANVPNIIWEPFNEPPGTTYSWSQLKTYHTAVVATIRAAGSQNLVVVGSPNWSQDVDVATQDPLTDANVAYTLHFYAGSHGSWLRDKANTAMSRNQAVMVTEWGTVDASGDGGYNPTESANWTAWMDQNKISSCNWSLHDKLESASALVAGASSTGPWSASDLTQSGTWVKAYIGAGQVTQYALTVTKSGTGTGTVTSSTGGINCGSTCSATYNSGTLVTLTAAATSPSTFGGWSGACSGTGTTCTVTMSAAQSVTATFTAQQQQTYALTVTKSGTGTGTVTSSTGGINCGSTCSATYNANTSVTLTAAATSPSTFASWSGCTSSSGVTCTVSMTAAKTVTATFNAQQQQTYALTVTKAGSGTGTVTASTGINCGSTCSATYNSGTSVTLTAAATSPSTFGGWSGACSGTATTCIVTMSAAQSVTATFNAQQQQTYTLTVTKAGTGAGTVTASTGINCGSTCSATYNSGTSVTLTAAATSPSTFGGWSGACSGTATTCTVTMSAAQSVTATFNTSSSTTPCSNPVTFSWATGNFNTTGAACFRTTQNVRGWGCSNMDGRTVSINGTAVTCGAGPFPLPKHTDGYTYFSATAGQYSWASIYVWE